MLVRLDPSWNYATCRMVAQTDTAKVDKNVEQQYVWGRRIFQSYVDLKPKFPVSWHMIGPRATDSMFYVQRVEAVG